MLFRSGESPFPFHNIMILLIIFIIPQTVPFVNMEYYTRNPCVFRKSWRFFGGIYGSATDSKKSTVHYTEYRRSLLFRILSFRKKRLQFNYNSQKAIVFLAVIVYNDRCRNQSAVTAWAVLCEMRCIFDEEDYILYHSNGCDLDSHGDHTICAE